MTSLHAAILFLSIIVAGKYPKVMFYICMSVAILITMSLIHRRYHYVIDGIVGFPWAWVAWEFGQQLY